MGYFNVQVNDTSTVYMSPINQLNDPEVIDIKNKVGDITHFSHFSLYNSHYSFKPRITNCVDIRLDRTGNNKYDYESTII